MRCLDVLRTLVLQCLYNLSNDELEFQTWDRYSFCHFPGVTPEDKTPDAKTIWLFQEQLVTTGLMGALSLDFNLQLDARDYKDGLCQRSCYE
ncbi:transposase [Microbulbifer sp. 2304DJ12-6]|uniref:transposase n=1 Tax=Microbulbifer sp. 2304DJ12-6 TaxID=3233340 RepID=UPI0039AF2F4A